MKPQELRNRLEGVQVIMMTPLTQDYQIDEQGLRKNTRFLLDSGYTWLTPVGSMGEGPSLTLEEQRRVTSIVLEETREFRNVVVTPGCISDATVSVIELAQWCKDAGAHGVMITPPYYFNLTFKDTLAHFKAIAEVVDIGIIFYYRDGRLTPDQMIELVNTIPNIVAIKDITRNVFAMHRYMRSIGDKVCLIAVPGDLMAPVIYPIGARAMMSSFANFVPDIPQQIHAAAAAGNYAEAYNISLKIAKVDDFVRDGNTLAKIKKLMEWKGLAGGPMRLPLTQSVSPENERKLRALAEEAGLL